MDHADPSQFQQLQTPRRADRVDRAFTAKICRDGKPDAIATVENLSPHGFRMAAVEGLPEHAFFHLEVAPNLRIPAQARWLQGSYVGCEFPRHLTSRQYLQLLHATGSEQNEPAPVGLIGRIRAFLGR